MTRFGAVLSCLFLCVSAQAKPASVDLAAHARLCMGPNSTAPLKPLSGPAYVLRDDEIEASFHKNFPDKSSLSAGEAFGMAGYRFDERRRRIIAPNGGVVSRPELKRLFSPYDASKEHLPSQIWNSFVRDGYRLDERDCRLYAFVAGRRKALQELVVVVWRRHAAQMAAVETMESMIPRLVRLDPFRPIPRQFREQIENVGRQGMGALPASFLHSLNKPAGALLRLVRKSYLVRERAFERRRDRPGRVAVPLPVLPSPASMLDWARRAAAWLGLRPRPKTPPASWPSLPLPVPSVPELLPAPSGPAQVLPGEKRLGRRISHIVKLLFRLTPSGKELLGRFRDAQGRLRLPPFSVLKYVQRSDDSGEGHSFAHYDPLTRSMAVNYWNFVSLLKRAVPDKDKALVARMAPSLDQIESYLLSHSSVLKTIIGRMDDALYHELTHAWQDRRLRIWRESLSGNAPTHPVDVEFEAFFAQLRHLHETIALNPGRAAASISFPAYLRALQNPGQFQQRIADGYKRDFFGSSDFAALRNAQALRERVSDGMKPRNFYEFMRRVLRHVGLGEGDAAIYEAKKDLASRLEKYRNEVFPHLRREALERDYPDRLAKAGRPDEGLALLGVVDTRRRFSQERLRLAGQAADFLSRPDNGLSQEERFNSETYVYGAYANAGKRLPARFDRMFHEDARAAVGRLLNSIPESSDGGEQALDRAYKASNVLSPSDPLRLSLAVTLEARGRPDRALLAAGFPPKISKAQLAFRLRLARESARALPEAPAPSSYVQKQNRVKLHLAIEYEFALGHEPYPAGLIALRARDMRRYLEAMARDAAIHPERRRQHAQDARRLLRYLGNDPLCRRLAGMK